ncbi:ABC transporter ATP-binding protein [Leptolyngbya sp. FACHB-261]|uniref:ABC transporter ATP-binding protein n=1 Tax=Leptolyngbya sp. FACHB-261 TaxID=2692806 RepID=UPI0016876E5E|nr:ABC transporter ATP-binding protein [Leptolyngbya sp. FACHB-261]MBD2099817.1 ABC transporter ATP-binding protein [Leptolyngbya sp. FACHB-261]
MPESSRKPIIELRNVHKRFGSSVILDDVSLKVYQGEALAVIGPSGTGKSTILRIIAGLLQPDQGSLLIDGKPIRQRQQIRIGMVFQNAALFDSLTVGENVGFYLYEHSNLSRREIQKIVADKLERVGLKGIEDRYPAQLSGGMRKRVSFARAIMEDPTDPSDDPQILLYDEPTAGLDPIASTVIEDLIRELQFAQKVCETYVIVTHQESTIRRTADRVVLLYGGKVRWDGGVDEIDTTDDPYVHQFFQGSLDGPIHVRDREAESAL